MNRYEKRPSALTEAQVQYRDGDYRVRRPGAYVICAATGVESPLAELRYWDVERQEPYASPRAVMTGLKAVTRD